MTELTTAHSEADQIAGRLLEGQTAWARTSLSRRRELLAEFATLVNKNADEWVEIAARIKQLPAGSPLLGEEWTSGPWAVLSYVGALAATIQQLDAGGDVLAGFQYRTAPGDRLAVQVLPHSTFDRLLLNGFKAEVWLQPGVTLEETSRTAGLGQLTPYETQGTALVLGAGNITSIAPLDVLYVLYADNRVVALKLNPIMNPLKDLFVKVFAPFIELGVVEILTCDLETGNALAHHAEVAAVHMTGSEQTHDAITWGTGELGLANKLAGTPLLTKPISSELGGVAPVIVVPGKWSAADLRFQAQHVATQRLHNSGHNCVAAQVLILSSDWAQKDAFLDELRSALADAPERPAWYPGCALRVADARGKHPAAEAVAGSAVRTLIPGLDVSDSNETAFHTEYFGPVLGVAELPGTGEAFLAKAVNVANDTLRGTLGANIIVDPRTKKMLGKALEEQVARLRYGTIGVNVWTAVGYLTPHATWGAFPGHPLDDIQSGRGVVHNALLLDQTERTVVTGPFRPFPRSILHGEASITPKPPWFVNNKTSATTGRRLSGFAARPRWRALPAIFASALRG
ncbi:aldehyde dehydrogenase family protein [Nocardioides sp. WS12]|uniref:aldehyde dehydrogenase family protein n=1 Tax=Nocardioides sp. WS12 TaxID=2486272 RepID=UPI0015F9A538|nr:aldehyde dehydrogenase family protein [Nocardioides sp. WS12]